MQAKVAGRVHAAADLLAPVAASITALAVRRLSGALSCCRASWHTEMALHIHHVLVCIIFRSCSSMLTKQADEKRLSVCREGQHGDDCVAGADAVAGDDDWGAWSRHPVGETSCAFCSHFGLSVSWMNVLQGFRLTRHLLDQTSSLQEPLWQPMLAWAVGFLCPSTISRSGTPW